MLNKFKSFFGMKPPEPPIVPPADLLPALTHELKNLEAAEYTLRMVWLGRSSKFPMDKVPAYDWISRTFLPETIAKQYGGFTPGEVQLYGQDHHGLARQCIVEVAKACGIQNDKRKHPSAI